MILDHPVLFYQPIFTLKYLKQSYKNPVLLINYGINQLPSFL